MNALAKLLEEWGPFIIIGLMVAGFLVIWNMIQQQNAITQAEITQLQKNSGGGGDILSLIGGIFGI